jgi:hypothetical protein
MRLIALGVVYVGLPGFLFGLALGIVIRRWVMLALIAVAAGVAVRYGAQRLDSGSSGDNDPRIILVVALVANLIGFLVGAASGRLLTRRRASTNGKPS